MKRVLITGHAAVLPRAVDMRVRMFSRAQTEAAPGAVASIIVIGSAITGDWWQGVSDIDAVFVLARSLTPDDIDALTGVHACSVGGGAVDGIYLTPRELHVGPAAVTTATQSTQGELVAGQPGGQLSWVTWLEVEAGAEAALGPAGLDLWRRSSRRFPDAEQGARDFSRRNLHEYWRPLADATRAQLAGRPDHHHVSSTALQWIALGPARLVLTIETGRITSKTDAAKYAARRWPVWAPLLNRAAAARSGTNITFTTADARAALELLDHCVTAYP